MSGQFVIDPASWQRFERATQEVVRFGSDLTPLGPVLYDEWFSPMEEMQFATEGAAGGDKWQELSEGYAKVKADKYGNIPTEQLPDHTLLSSLTDRNAEGAIYDPQRESIIYGTALPYARRQHYGDPSINLAGRELIAPSEASLLTAEGLVLREWISFIEAALAES
jgi:hypothetical protein